MLLLQCSVLISTLVQEFSSHRFYMYTMTWVYNYFILFRASENILWFWISFLVILCSCIKDGINFLILTLFLSILLFSRASCRSFLKIFPVYFSACLFCFVICRQTLIICIVSNLFVFYYFFFVYWCGLDAAYILWKSSKQKNFAFFQY